MPLEQIPGAVYGAIGGIFVAIMGFFGVFVKGRGERDAKIMESWEALNAQHLEQMREARAQFRQEVEDLRKIHKQEIAELKEDFAAYKLAADLEIAGLRKRVTEVEAEFTAYRMQAARDIQERDEMIAGMRKNATQVYESSVRVQKDNRDFQEKSEAKHQTSVDDRSGIHEQMDKLNGGLGDNSRNKKKGDDA